MAVDGFYRADTLPLGTLVCAVSGLDKSGKTNFACTAPPPIYYHNFDVVGKAVVAKFAREKEIWIADYPYTSKDGTAAWEAAWAKFKKDFSESVMRVAGGKGTVVVDSATEKWELSRLANFGKLTQVRPHHYGAVNAEMRELIRLCYINPTNAVFVFKKKAVWENDQRTGRYEPAGFGDMPFLVQANLDVWWEPAGAGGGGEFHMMIKNSTHNMGVAGEQLDGEMISWDTVTGMLFG